MKKLPKKWIWVRKGDADNYHNFDALEAVAKYLKGINKVERRGALGVHSSDYQGNNYISLFWGDFDAQPIRDISDTELRKLNRLLKVHHADISERF